jgi:hypothetical protein
MYSNKVQCISTKSGFYEHLKLGAWYEPKNIINNRRYKDKIIIEHHHLNKNGVYITTQVAYDKVLFRTVNERRDDRLSKLLNI